MIGEVNPGHFKPDPDRHDGFGFAYEDEGLGVSHVLKDLSHHPDDPSLLIAHLETLFEGVPVLTTTPPKTVSWSREIVVQETRNFPLTPMLEEARSTRIAVGSLTLFYAA
ncbi:MAG TPA: hypothetical protein VGF75_07590 [Candidatus Saccharimonadales bacterium]|jgi:hypothetical protein